MRSFMIVQIKNVYKLIQDSRKSIYIFLRKAKK